LFFWSLLNRGRSLSFWIIVGLQWVWRVRGGGAGIRIWLGGPFPLLPAGVDGFGICVILVVLKIFFWWIVRPGEAKKMSMTVQGVLTAETRSQRRELRRISSLSMDLRICTYVLCILFCRSQLSYPLMSNLSFLEIAHLGLTCQCIERPDACSLTYPTRNSHFIPADCTNNAQLSTVPFTQNQPGLKLCNIMHYLLTLHFFYLHLSLSCPPKATTRHISSLN